MDTMRDLSADLLTELRGVIDRYRPRVAAAEYGDKVTDYDFRALDDALVQQVGDLFYDAAQAEQAREAEEAALDEAMNNARCCGARARLARRCGVGV